MAARQGSAKPAGTRRRMSAAEREDQIVKSAIAFFSRRGVDAQIRELAEEIGIAHTLLYHYFPTKQALIDRVYEELFVGRWDPRWEALLDEPLPIQDKLCAFYESYLAAILTPEWMRIIVGSGLSDGVIPGRYFGMLQERLLPKVIRETRKAFGNRSRARATAREQALLMGLHGGLVYSLGIWPYVYGQRFEGQGNPTVIAQIIRDRVQSYLAHAAAVMPGSNKSRSVKRSADKPAAGALRRVA